MIDRRALALSVVLALVLAGCGGGGTASSGLPPATTPANGTLTQSVASTASGPVALPALHIDPARIVVAGISAGGFFGVQFQFAHSTEVKAAAIYAGGVDWCAQDSVALALAECGGEGSYASTLSQSEAYVDQQSAAGTIDPVSNVRGMPVYLWSGTQDKVVDPREMADLQSEEQHYGATIVRFDNTYPAAHGWESPDGELSCGTQGEPYMIACSGPSGVYDSVGTWFTAFFQPTQPRNPHPQGSLIQVDQSVFGAGPSNSMDTTGWLFVPKPCAAGGRCGLVVAFHGCQQTQADIANTFAREAGIDEWADGNNVVVFYPYAVRSQTVPYNPQGCWDWWGYDDPNYATKAGTQIGIVDRMIGRLSGH